MAASLDASLSASLDASLDASLPRWDAIIVAGGGVPRLAGIGRSPLRMTLDAVRQAEQVAIVGYGAGRHPVPDSSPVASAIALGLHNLRESGSDFTAVVSAVVSASLPRLAAALALLVEEIGSGSVEDGLVAFDRARAEPLLAIYRTRSLREAAAGLSHSASPSMRRLVGSLSLRQVSLPAN
jgi:molybdopterin-guanine dinucleotide biosynthesis protein A